MQNAGTALACARWDMAQLCGECVTRHAGAIRRYSPGVAYYYDADDLTGVNRWIEAAKPFPNIRGLSDTPRTRKYDLPPSFGDLLQ